MLLTLCVYLPAFGAGYFVDDWDYVVENENLRSLDGLRRIWVEPAASPQYYPLTLTSFWLEYRVWQARPLAYHAVNVVLHGLNAVLFWLLLRELGVAGALFAASVFALHPVHVSSVAWISERKNVLCAFFALLSLLSWSRFLEGRIWKDYALAAVLFLCALLSKTVVVGLPLIFALIGWWRFPSTWRRNLAPLAPLVLVGVLFGAITVIREPDSPYALALLPELPFPARLMVAARALWFYTVKLFFPMDLMVIYPSFEFVSRSATGFLWLLAAAAVPSILWLQRQALGRGPLVAVLFFSLTIAPALGILSFGFMQYSNVSDHFQYVPSMGLLALFGAVAQRVGERFRMTASLRMGAAVLIVAIFGSLTWQRTRLYEDGERLWRDNLRRNPAAWFARYNLGTLLYREGRDLDVAARQFQSVVRARPEFAGSHYNWGGVLVLQARLEEALPHLREAVRLNSENAAFRRDLGFVLMQLGQLAVAEAHLREAIRLRPDAADARNYLGIVLFRQEQLDASIEQLSAAVRLNPELGSAHNTLAVALARQGRLKDAIFHGREGVRLETDNRAAHYNLGLLLVDAGLDDEAVSEFEAALEIDAMFAEAYYQLARVLARQGDDRAAVWHCERAVHLKPGYTEAGELLRRLRSESEPRS